MNPTPYQPNGCLRKVALTEVGVQNLPIDQLAPYKNNARTHSQKQIRQIADSIEMFGFTNPILIDENMQILAGHGRVSAARLLAWETVPCVQIDQLTEGQKRAYVLADNKLAQNAGWDIDLLSSELAVLTKEFDIDIGLTGFSIAEVDEILDLGGIDQENEGEEDNQLPDLEDLACTRAGDVWKLGDHLLLCGDARMEHSFECLLSATEGTPEVAKMVFTDPPYNVVIDKNVCGVRHQGFWN